MTIFEIVRIITPDMILGEEACLFGKLFSPFVYIKSLICFLNP